MKTRFLALCSMLLLTAPAHSSGLPDLGDVASDELSVHAERRLGESIMRSLRQREPAYLDDPEAEDYLNRLGRRLVAASPQPDREFEFFLINDPTLNAFALPGGFIGVHTGLIAAAESESELASVLGHEVAHVTQRHIARMVGKQSQAGMLMLASMLVAVLAARSGSDVSQAALVAGQAGALQSQLAYSRDFEREADRLGLQTLDAAGFDVRAMPMFFERLQRASRLYENNAPAYLRTHPLTLERIADMGNRVDGMRYRQIVDSLDFQLIRTRLNVRQMSPAEALEQYRARIQDGQRQPANYYGLAFSALRAGQLDEAERQLRNLPAETRQHPLLIALEAELLLARKQFDKASERLGAALREHAEWPSLRYRLIEAALQGGKPAAARDVARAGIDIDARNPRLWTLLARSEAALGHRTAQHRAQGEAYALIGALPAAIQQLELARDARDGDFYELSAVDARLRELRTLYRELQRERGELPAER